MTGGGAVPVFWAGGPALRPGSLRDPRLRFGPPAQKTAWLVNPMRTNPLLRIENRRRRSVTHVPGQCVTYVPVRTERGT